MLKRFAKLLRRIPIPIVLFAIFSVVTVALWLRNGQPVGWSDSGLISFYYHPSLIMRSLAAPWNAYAGLGGPSAQNIAQLPWAAVFAAGRWAGISYVLLQGFLYVAILFGTLVLFFYLFRNLVATDNMFVVTAATVGSLFVGYSVINAENYWMFGNNSIFLPVLLPGACLIIMQLQYVRTSTSTIRIGVLVLFCLPSFANPAYVIPVVFAGMAIGLCQVTTLREFVIVSRRAVLAAVILVALFAWFIFPFVATAGTLYKSASLEESNLQTLIAASANTNVGSLLRLIPLSPSAPVWASYWAPVWRLWFDLPPLVAIFVIIGVVIIIGAVRGDGTNIRVRIAAITISIVGVVLSIGVGFPTGKLYMLGYRSIPLSALFRDPVNKFIPFLLLGAGILFFLGTVRLLEGICTIATGIWQRRSAGVVWRGSAVVLAVAVLAYGFPLSLGLAMRQRVHVAGVVIRSGNAIPRDVGIIARKLHSSATSARLLVLPLSPTGYRWLHWRYGYTGPDLSWLLYQTPTISSTAGQLGPAGSLLNGLLALSPVSLLRLAERMGVGYVLIEKNVVFVGPGLADRGRLNSQAYVTALADVGARVVLRERTSTLYRLPVRNSLVGFAGTPAHGSAVLMARSLAQRGYPLEVGLSDSGGGVLSYHEAYNHGWQARIIGTMGASSKYKCRSLVGTQLRHQLYDSYANAWRVPPGGSGCEVKISINYRGMVLMDLGWMISVITAGMLVLWFGFALMVELRNVRRKRLQCVDNTEWRVK